MVDERGSGGRRRSCDEATTYLKEIPNSVTMATLLLP